VTNGRAPPRAGRPAIDRPPQQLHDRPPQQLYDRPPQQLYDRPAEPRKIRRSPPQQYADGRGPPSRDNTFPLPNDVYDPRGPPPRGYEQQLGSRGMHQDPRRIQRNEDTDQMLDQY